MSKDKKRKTMFVSALILFCLGIGVYFYLNSWIPENNRLPRENDAVEGYLPGMSDEEIQKMMDEKVAEGSVQISINSSLIFKDGKSRGNVRIENSKNNHYLMIVEMIRKDNRKTIFKSGVIEPGYYLEKARLKGNLPAGDYPVEVHFKNYDMNTEEYVGEAVAECTIHILN